MSYAQVNGVSLHFDWRDGAGVPLVLLHEMGGALESWDLVLRHLPGRAVLRLDLRGFGRSEKPSGAVALSDHTGDVTGLIKLLGLGPVHLAGCAVGGGVAIATAAAMGPQVAALTAFAPATGVPPERRAGVLNLAQMLEEGGLRAFLMKDTLPKAWPEPRFAQRGEGFEIFCGTQLGTSPASLAATYRMLAQMDLGPALSGLTCPARFVAGTQDVARTPALVKAVAERVRGARFCEIDSGHFMALQTPKLVADLLA
ncbi:Arylesterase [Aquimixticola soesokkakensis]|uniref:Arylesterase n=1 Tax=Aquimixticola soesokkakensis TaxID=1519096 RepID=A0A1Y5RQ25_9RHOB|nr:alpha/beta hydrolase [Aquimixticola soesokkakensis]SLN22695.1 Arylesterase [Aquimixticola soesokkakensis]